MSGAGATLGGEDPHDLARFLAAQDGAIDRALAELSAGAKRSHWMWYVFPQIAGLGSSPMAQRYAISGLAEARAYLAHPVLGPRLREAVAAAMRSGERSPRRLMGTPDDLKLRSSLTLFAQAARAAGEDPAAFEDALARFFDGERCVATLSRLGARRPRETAAGAPQRRPADYIEEARPPRGPGDSRPPDDHRRGKPCPNITP
ncbi:DUF1810 domain-containing protein [Albimonas sp. CAU 1670]|uniref:DUF1810 domain-containing protein n=1 Tax=Albimonas sp. CAU 1670 TaxID=3032599 RepID=UPI0023DCE060|nr:DUF1810 domain-containing protein [Albimonas sp. CAU 1670]MDF2233282.1 DUF1810 domain-containing protein [Albimonas sp. CAU 1670]